MAHELGTRAWLYALVGLGIITPPTMLCIDHRTRHGVATVPATHGMASLSSLPRPATGGVPLTVESYLNSITCSNCFSHTRMCIVHRKTDGQCQIGGFLTDVATRKEAERRAMVQWQVEEAGKILLSLHLSIPPSLFCSLRVHAIQFDSNMSAESFRRTQLMRLIWFDCFSEDAG